MEPAGACGGGEECRQGRSNEENTRSKQSFFACLFVCLTGHSVGIRHILKVLSLLLTFTAYVLLHRPGG